MYCAHCGSAISSDAKFCSRCGNKNKSENINEPIQAEKSQYKGLSGWLIVLIIHMIINCVLYFFSIAEIMDTKGLYQDLGVEEDFYYYDLFTEFFMLSYTIYIIYLFFNRKFKFSKIFIGYWLTALGISTLNFMIYSVVLPLDGEETFSAFLEVLKLGVISLIYILYLKNSKRVKETFIE